jgi:hypothetical protein
MGESIAAAAARRRLATAALRQRKLSEREIITSIAETTTVTDIMEQ